MEQDWRKKYPIIVGRKGIDDFFTKCADGEITPWPSQEELERSAKEYEQLKLQKCNISSTQVGSIKKDI